MQAPKAATTGLLCKQQMWTKTLVMLLKEEHAAAESVMTGPLQLCTTLVQHNLQLICLPMQGCSHRGPAAVTDKVSSSTKWQWGVNNSNAA